MEVYEFRKEARSNSGAPKPHDLRYRPGRVFVPGREVEGGRCFLQVGKTPIDLARVTESPSVACPNVVPRRAPLSDVSIVLRLKTYPCDNEPFSLAKL